MKDKIRPDMPEDVERRELRRLGDYKDLVVEEYELDDSQSKIYVESGLLEGLIGYTPEEIVERVDSYYEDVNFGSVNVNSLEYGNGWAILDVEE